MGGQHAFWGSFISFRLVALRDLLYLIFFKETPLLIVSL